MDNHTENKDNLLGILETLARYRRYIIGVCAIVGIGAFIIALLLPVYYQATTLFLAASPDLTMPERIFGTSATDMQYFGNNNDNDRLLTIAESSELADFLIREFNLYEHYNIDSTGPKAGFYIQEKFFDLYDVQKTKRDALQIAIEDKDPQLAAAMANAARDRIDVIARGLIKESQQRLMDTYKSSIDASSAQLSVLGDSIQAVRNRYGVYNAEAQSETLSGLLATTQSKLASSKAKLEALKKQQGRIKQDSIIFLEASVQGMENQLANLNQQLAQLNQGMSNVEGMTEEYEQAVLQLSYKKERYKQIMAAYNSDASTIILVEKATVPIVKSRPKRSILILAAVAIAFIFSVVAVLLLDTYKDVDWKRLGRLNDL